jgi:hypothetical protein
MVCASHDSRPPATRSSRPRRPTSGTAPTSSSPRSASPSPVPAPAPARYGPHPTRTRRHFPLLSAGNVDRFAIWVWVWVWGGPRAG